MLVLIPMHEYVVSDGVEDAAGIDKVRREKIRNILKMQEIFIKKKHKSYGLDTSVLYGQSNTGENLMGNDIGQMKCQ